MTIAKTKAVKEQTTTATRIKFESDFFGWPIH
jgi:hypothetical protein